MKCKNMQGWLSENVKGGNKTFLESKQNYLKPMMHRPTCKDIRVLYKMNLLFLVPAPPLLFSSSYWEKHQGAIYPQCPECRGGVCRLPCKIEAGCGGGEIHSPWGVLGLHHEVPLAGQAPDPGGSLGLCHPTGRGRAQAEVLSVFFQGQNAFCCAETVSMMGTSCTTYKESAVMICQ